MNPPRLLFLFLGLCAGARAQMPVSEGEPGPGTAIAAALARAAPHLPAGGFVAAEMQDDAVRYLTAGQPAPMEGIPPERVIFEVGSIAKVFTGLLLAQAVVEHRVALGDSIRKFIPPAVAMDPAVAAITLEELAANTSGLPRMPTNLRLRDPLDPFADYTVEDLYAFLRADQPKGRPPQPADYSNLGTGLLGHVLELVYHEPYGRLLAEKITGPLGLPDTVTVLSEEQESRFALPHLGPRVVRPQGAQDAFIGATGLYSTAADLVRLVHVLMLDFDHPLAGAWELARPARADFPAMNGKAGLGVLIMEQAGSTVYWHGGTTAGTRSHLEWTPQKRHALVVLMNSDSIEAMNLVVSLYTLKAPAR